MAMMHLAAYDVHEDQRRAQLSALLQAYGDRIQYSVFLLGITPEELVEIQSRAAGIAGFLQPYSHAASRPALPGMGGSGRILHITV